MVSPRFLAFLLVPILFLAGSPVPAQGEPTAPAEASIEQSTLPAAGRHATTFRVPHFGRWSVALASERGVALQLVDRVNGPGEIVGTTGQVDGRLDLFLDRGEYRVLSHGADSEADLGEATLTVRPFRDAEERAVTLPDLAEVETELGDLEQVSWWLQLDKKQRVAFEAAGRHLEDFRLWRDGTWMVGEEPTFEDVEPVVGRPLRIARLAVELPAGLYRLTAYGGVGLPWAEDDGSRPLYLRSGVPKRGEAGRSRLELSKFGIDRFVVPASASFYRLEVPDGDLRSDAVVFGVDDWSETDPYDAGAYRAETIHKELRELVAEHQRPVDEDGLRVVTVRGAASQPYVLQHFRREPVYRFEKKGEYWIDTIHSGHPADPVEATAMLFDLRTVSRYARPIRAEVVRLRSDSLLRRRFNLHERATVFLEAVQGGSYRLGLDGMEAEVRLEPYLLPGQTLEERPPKRRLEPGESTDWELDPGYYVLTLEPEEQGVADLTLGAVTAVQSGDGNDAGAAPTARLGRVYLDDASYLLHQNEQPGIRSGVVLRAMPLDLSEPLPFVLSGTADRSTVTVPFKVPGQGFLRAVAEDGTELPLRLEGAAVEAEEATTLAVSKSGTVIVSAPSDFDLPTAVSLFWEPQHRREPLPALPAGTLEALPELPVLTADREQFLELGRRERQTLLVRAAEAALYRLESTGLLDTTGVLRTRVVPELEREDGEGSGRNFRIQRYLAAGEYQLTVSSRGRSQGTLGLRLASTPVRPAGRLEPSVAARGWIDADESLAYRFRVDEPGRWRLRVLGLDGPFPIRVEDVDGWPLIRPGRPGDQTVELDAGEHRLVVLPQAVRARHLAVVEPIPEPPERAGHGPFDLVLGETVEHLWQEPPDAFRSLVDTDRELPFDRWKLALSAPVELLFDLSRDVVADVVRVPEGEVLGRVTSLRALDQVVPAGSYEIRVRPARRGNRVDYTLRVEPSKLIPGYGRRFTVPSTVPLSVGSPSLVEITSFGTLDVRARLLDADGRQLAQSDDRPGDWNLRLVHRLEPGQYEIELGGSSGEVRLDAAVLDEVVGEPMDVAEAVTVRSLTPGRSVQVVPLEGLDSRVDRTGVVMARADSAEGLRLTLEAHEDEAAGKDPSWRAVAFGEGRTARLAYVPAAGEELRLRLEVLDRGSSEVTLSATRAGTQTVDESRLARGVRVRDDLGGHGVVAVALERAGCFDFSERPEDLQVIGEPGRALRAAPDLASAGEVLWLSAPAGTEVRAERWLWPADGDSRRLRLLPGERATCDLEPSDATRLLSARGLGDQATLAIAGGAAQAADGSEALALALPLTGTASLGLGSPAAAGDFLAQPGEVQLSARSFEERPPRGVVGANGRLDGTVAAGTSRLYSLPPGAHRLRLTLGAGVAAAITTGRNVDWLHRASREGVEVVRDVRTEGEGTSYLRILAPVGSGDGLFDVTLLHHLDDRLAVSEPDRAVVLERGVQRTGVLDVDVPASEDLRRLQVRGAERATLLGAEGSIHTARGPEAELPVPADGGRLVVEHGPGYVMAWLGDGVASLDPSPSREPRSLSLPSVQTLTAPGASFVVRFDEPKVLHLRAPTSALISLTTPGGGWTELATDAVSMDAWLPAGESTLTIRSLAGRGFGGDLEATASDVVQIGEGLGPEMLLPPGASRYASFEVERASRIGAAVRAESEVVSARLLDARGRELPDSDQGVLLMRDLEPGRYLLAFSLPADHPPVRVRPVVVGLDPPTGPPDDVVRRYLELADLSEDPP